MTDKQFEELKKTLDQIWEKLEDIEYAVRNISRDPQESTELEIKPLISPLAAIQSSIEALRSDVLQ